MQTCYNCGKEVPDETLICPDCGALVRRYTNPPPRMNEQPPQNEPPRQEWNPQQAWNPRQPWVQPQDPEKPKKVIFFGGTKLWLIILAAFSCYMAFSSLCSVFVCLNVDSFLQVMQAAEIEAYVEFFEEFQSLVPQLFPYFLAMSILFTVKAICHIWLLKSGRKLPFRVSIGTSIVGLVCIAILGGSVLDIFYFLDPFFVWPSLRRYWPWMGK